MEGILSEYSQNLYKNYHCFSHFMTTFASVNRKINLSYNQ